MKDLLQDGKSKKQRIEELEAAAKA